MNREFGHYRLALYVIWAVAAIQLLLICYLGSINLERAKPFVLVLVVTLSIIFGLWVHSKFARYVGGVWFAIWVAGTAWALFAQSKFVWDIFQAGFIVLGMLSALAAYLLLASPKFSSEFSLQREVQSKIKNSLRQVAIVVLVGTAIVATAIDIQHLASN